MTHMYTAPTLKYPVSPGEYIRVVQLRHGASILMLVTDAKLYDAMASEEQEEVRKFGWDITKCEDEYLIRGRRASEVGGPDKVFSRRSVPLSKPTLPKLVLRAAHVWWPAREIVGVLDVVPPTSCRAKQLEGVRDAYVLDVKGNHVEPDAPYEPITPAECAAPVSVFYSRARGERILFSPCVH